MDLPCYIIQSSFSKELLEKMFNYYLNIDWKTTTFTFSGKEVTPSRKTFMFGIPYKYSGIIQPAIHFDKKILFIKHSIEKQLNLPIDYFNACLLNLYPSGESSISYHKDDEPEMDKNAIIVSFSLGESRKFYLKNDNKNIKNRTLKLIVNNGDILIMKPEVQKNWKHSIPKEKNIIEPRISFTFRKFL